MPESLTQRKTRLRIGVDGLNLALPHGAGVATYARTLSLAVRHAGHRLDLLFGLETPSSSRPGLQEALFFAALGGVDTRRRRRAPPRWLAPRAVEVPLDGEVVRDALAHRLPSCDRLFNAPGLFEAGARRLRAFGRFLTIAVPDPPDVMHWTYPVPVRLKGARNLYTVHDLVPLKLPFATLDDRAAHDRLIRSCIRYGDGLCTVSRTSRADILARYPAARVTDTSQAVPPPPDPPSEHELAERLDRLFGLPRDGYLLTFGAVEPKKNLGRLVEAYALSGVRTPLVTAGPAGWLSRNELRLLEGARRSPAADRVRRLGWLPASHLQLLVRGARAVLFPSLYEGFGLPAVEAMALGAPVLASTGGALPEVTGGAALLVDPYDVEAMAEAVRRLDADADLRASLRRAGLARARDFDLPAYAARLEALYAGLTAGAERPRVAAARSAAPPSRRLRLLSDPSS